MNIFRKINKLGKIEYPCISYVLLCNFWATISIVLYSLHDLFKDILQTTFPDPVCYLLKNSTSLQYLTTHNMVPP